jgi:DNA-binding response OmpR family regulator
LNILVVEDDAALRKLYQVKLASWLLRPNVDTVGDGYQALIRMGDVKPDLLVLDLQMPGVDGFRMLQTIGSVPELAGMVVVVVSGLDAEDIAARGGVPEGITVLPKPVPFERLRAIAERLVAVRDKHGRGQPA